MGLLLNSAPKLKSDYQVVSPPMPTRMSVDAPAVKVQRENFDHEIVEKIEGYRLTAEFTWESLLNLEIEDLIEFNNSQKKYFQLYDRWFPMVITEFQKPNPVLQRDNCILKMRSIRLLSQYPNPDLWYVSHMYFEPIIIV